MKLEFSWQIFETCSNIKFHENPPSGRRVFWRTLPDIPCGVLTSVTCCYNSSYQIPQESHNKIIEVTQIVVVKGDQVRGSRWSGDAPPVPIQLARIATSRSFLTAWVKWAGIPSYWNQVRELSKLTASIPKPISLWRRCRWHESYLKLLHLQPPKFWKISLLCPIFIYIYI